MTIRKTGIPLALGAVGLLAAAGLLRQRGSLASDPKARTQHFRRLLEPSSGAAEAERQFARRRLAETEAEAGQDRKGRAPGVPPRPTPTQDQPREMKRGSIVGRWYNGRGHERYNIVIDGVPNGGGYIANKDLAISEFDRTVREMMAYGKYNKVELRARVPAIRGQIDPRKDHLLMDVEWQRHDGLDKLFDKIFLLMTLSQRSLWPKGLDPRDRGGPFILNGDEVWSQALRVLVEMHPFRHKSKRLRDISWVHPVTLGLVGEFDYNNNELWPMLHVQKPEGNRQTWAAVFIDDDDQDNNRMLHLGTNPLMLYEAIENMKREMPGRRFWVELIPSYTVRYADRSRASSLPGMGEAPGEAPGATPVPTSPAAVHTLLPAPVQVYRERVEAIRDRCQRNESLLETASWNDVLRLIDNEAEYEEWFDGALKRHK